MNRFIRNAGAFLCGILFVAIVAVSMGQTTGGFPSRPKFRTVSALDARTAAVAPFLASSTIPAYRLNETDAAANEKQWEWNANGGALVGRLYNDSGGGTVTWLELDRTGNSPDTFALGGSIGAATIDTLQLLSTGTVATTAGTGISFTATTGNVTLSEGGTARDVATVEVGTYTGTVTGCTTAPTVSIAYTLVGNRLADGVGGIVNMKIPTVTCTSNSTGFSITGAPVAIRPSLSSGDIVIHRFTDNSVAASDGSFSVGMSNSGVLEFQRGGSGTGFTNVNTKGITEDAINLSYQLDTTP